MTDRAIGAAEVRTGETEPSDFDGVGGSVLVWSVARDVDEFEVVEDIAVVVERRSGGTILESEEGSESLGHTSNAS